MGSGASRKSAGNKSPRGKDQEDDVDPLQHIPPEQTLVHQDLVWKLNTGANPKNKGDWLRRKMWLTSKGGFFYYSRQFNKAVGRSIVGVDIKVVEGVRNGRYLLEVHPIAIGSVPHPATMQPTILAVDTLEQRDTWVLKTQELKQKCNADGLEENFLVDHKKRRRMSIDVHKGPALLTVDAAPLDYGKVDTNVEGVMCAKMSMISACEPQQNMKNMASVGPSLFMNQCSIAPTSAPATAPLDNISEGSGVIRQDSQDEFNSRGNSYIVLDWDDTLFPTTWIRGDLELDWKRTLEQQLSPSPEKEAIENRLELLSQRAEQFLRRAESVAHVFVVTLARRPWVDISAKNFMPIFEKLLEELNISVIYARDAITEQMEREYNAAEFRSSDQEIDFWMRAKAKAMELEFEKEHSKKGISWKNIASFGDSEIERRALQYVAAEHIVAEGKGGRKQTGDNLTAEVLTKTGHLQRLRAKTLKMIDDPSVEELIAQLTIMTTWVPFLVNDAMGLDIELEDSGDDDRLIELNKQITGRDEKLTWPQLAGME